MRKIIPFIAGLLLFCGFKTPGTSSLFEKCIEPESGVEMYILKQDLADYNRQSLCLTDKSMTDDGRFLVFLSCPDEMVPEGENGKEYRLIDFKTDKLINLGLPKTCGQAWLDVKNNILYARDSNKGIVICRKLDEDPAKDVIPHEIPGELQETGEMKSPCLQLTQSGKKETFPIGVHTDVSADSRYVVGDVKLGESSWRLHFYDRETGRGKFVCQILPPAAPCEKPSEYHPAPHPCFVCNDRYIVFTRNEWKYRSNLAVIPVARLAERVNGQWLGELPEQADPLRIYRKLARQLISTEPEAYAPKGYDGKRPQGNGKYVHYSVTSAYVNALQIADNIGDKPLLDSIAKKFKPFQDGSKKRLQSLDFHVDHSIFGATALEYYRVLGNDGMKELGLRYADHQWAEPSREQPYPGYIAPYEKQLEYLRQGYSPQTRLWIDDMYMINLLQTQAYRATGDPKYIERAAKEMVLYLKELQLPDGLFHHAADVPFVWGRGDGWMAAGMPMILQYLTPDSEYYTPIKEGYLKMMKSLLKWQRRNGLWGQLVTDKGSWDETSCSAMFTYAFIQGIKHGWLDRNRYGKAARKAWITLTGMLDEHGNLPGVCAGTGARNDRQWYMDRPRINGDPHGMAPMLWICNALL